MASMTFDQIMHAAEQLTPEEQAVLIAHLRARLASVSGQSGITREQALAELERRRAAGGFEDVRSLRGRFAHPALDLSFEEIQAITRQAASEWESSLDALDDGD